MAEREGLLTKFLQLVRKHSGVLAWPTADLAVGSAPSPADWPRLAALGVQSVVEVRGTSRDDPNVLGDLGLNYLHLSLSEGEAPSTDCLLEAADWVAAEIRAGRKVLIHCDEGLGRSPLVACAALSRLGFSVQVAYAMMRSVQPRVQLSTNQARALAMLADTVGKGPGRG